MSGNSLDEERMAAATYAINTVVPRMRTQLNQLDGEMEALFNGWKGRASTSFQRVHGQWHQDFLKLTAQLEGIGQGLERCRATIVAADEQSTAKG
jgi:WXG100 family type VII secretion target